MTNYVRRVIPFTTVNTFAAMVIRYGGCWTFCKCQNLPYTIRIDAPNQFYSHDSCRFVFVSYGSPVIRLHPAMLHHVVHHDKYAAPKLFLLYTLQHHHPGSFGFIITNTFKYIYKYIYTTVYGPTIPLIQLLLFGLDQ